MTIWDQRLAEQAAIVIQMEKLGAIKLDPNKKKVGFQDDGTPRKDISSTRS